METDNFYSTQETDILSKRRVLRPKNNTNSSQVVNQKDSSLSSFSNIVLQQELLFSKQKYSSPSRLKEQKCQNKRTSNTVSSNPPNHTNRVFRIPLTSVLPKNHSKLSKDISQTRSKSNNVKKGTSTQKPQVN